MKTHALYLGCGEYVAAIGKPIQRTDNSFRALQVDADEAARLAAVIPGAKPILVLDSAGWRKSQEIRAHREAAA